MALLAQNTFTLKRLAKDGLSINLGNYSQSVPCNSSGNASAAMTITIPFWGYRGANKVACTCTSPAVNATLVTGVTVSSVTNATESAAGSIVLAVASGATFGSSATRSGVFNLVFSIEGETVTLQFGWSKAVAGATGATGAVGKRVVSGLVYYQLASSTAPSVPTATAYNFTNNAFTGLTENWALTPPVFEAGNANKFWYVGFYVQETASGGGTGTPAFSTVKQAISFSGLVTFTADNAVSDGTKTLSFGETGTTEINGSKITTGKVSAERIEVEDLAALEAFINNLIVKRLVTANDGLGAYVEIQNPTTASPVASINLRSSDGAANHGFVKIYVEDNAETGVNATLSVNKHSQDSARGAKTTPSGILLFSNSGLSQPATSEYYQVFYDHHGLYFRYKVASDGVWTEYFRLSWDLTDGLMFKLSGLQNTNPGTDRVWKDSHGYLKIGDGAAYAEQSHNHTKSQITDFPTSMPASDVSSWAKAAAKPSYSASEVGALAGNAIQFFTQAEWNALTQAQKDAIPLALVQES